MKNIEISDITSAINKKDSLNNNLFLIQSEDDGENEVNENNQFLIQPISTKVYSNNTIKKSNKIEVINEGQEVSNTKKEKNKENTEEQSTINEISENHLEISETSRPSITIKNTNSEYIQTSLGQSIILLLNSNNKALVSAIDMYKKSTFIKTPLTSALQNIDKYIRNDKAGNAIKIIYNPLKEMIIKKKSNSNNSFKILNWLYFNSSTKKQLKEFLIEETQNKNKKSKLIAIQIYKNIIDEQSHALKKNEDISNEDIEFWMELNKIYNSLIDIIQNYGVTDKNGNTLPTLLTTLSYQVIISVFSSNVQIILNKNKIRSKSESTSNTGIMIEEISKNSLQDFGFYSIYWESIQCLSCALGCLVFWDQKKYPLFDNTINEILDFVNIIILRKENDPSKEYEIADVIAKLWININPYLSTKHIKNPVEKTRKIIEKIIDEENEDFGHFGSLLKLALILGHQKQENIIKIFKLDQIKENFLKIVSSNILNSEFTAGRNLGFFILRKFLLIDGPERFKPMVDQLIIMLDQDDSVSKASIGFLAEYAAYLPEDVLPSIFLKLDSDKPIERMNSLFVIYEIFQVNQDLLKSDSHSRLRSVLTEQLLLRIADEDIKLRNEASLLFCYLDQNEIIPKLADKLTDSDERVRAASEAALVNTLLKHKSNLDVIFTYIEYIRTLNQENNNERKVPNIPMNPGQIFSVYTKDKHQEKSTKSEYTKEQKEKLMERQFRVIKKWAKELSINSWIYIIEPLLKKVYASPEDQILVKIMSVISEYLVDPSVVKIIIKKVTKLMIEQPKLTENLLNRNDDESTMMVKDILFLRISPLLILRVLPNKAYETLDVSKNYIPEEIEKDINSSLNKDNKEENNNNNDVDINEDSIDNTIIEDIKDKEVAILLFKELIKRIEQIYEFDQVRKLSVEILASFPIDYILPYLKYKFEEEKRTKDLMQLKSYLYCLCNVIIKHPIKTLECSKFIEFSFHIPLEILILYSKDLDTKNKAIQNIQMGCIECLSLIVCSFVRSIPGEDENRKVLIKEINPSPVIEIINDNDVQQLHSDNKNNNNENKCFLTWTAEHVLYALLQLLNPFHLNKISFDSKQELGKNLPKLFQNILTSLFEIKEKFQPLIFEILSISIANILTTTIRHYSKEIEPLYPPTANSNSSHDYNKPNSSVSSTPTPTPTPTSIDSSSTSTPARSKEELRKNIRSLYIFATHYLLLPLLDTVQEGIQYHSTKETDLSILKDQLNNTLTCACLQVLYHLVYYLRNGQFKEKELEDILNVCLNGLSCDKSMIRESSLKLFSGLLSCNYQSDKNTVTSHNSTSNFNINIAGHEVPASIPPIEVLNKLTLNDQDKFALMSSSSSSASPNQSSDNVFPHGLFSQGRHALELVKAKRAIQQIAEMEEITTSTPTLSLARQLIVLMNTY
ncbi:hypothetical protein LY90DRAFT_671539 [Neocallimastix californiae]|uniref:ARM repeat-containing protein n=1 Tax=Neocallimastix californiae TaxID=1754190 RepID=A0A1Y2CES1_9FUNG|nr:hypothetical protein LY90DRAFT_671539 [Neocallimastix californiae]|eukprot:ORY45426.1 hypothetical protein LY90DRAFT_671539 [Neocallimastix californiae]